MRTPVTGKDWRLQDGAPIEVLLHVVDCYLNELEIVSYSAAIQFPDPQEVEVWVKDEARE